MANKPKEAEVRADVLEYLAEAVSSTPQVKPITWLGISKALRFHRNTLRKYVSEADLDRARETQRRQYKSAIASVRRTVDERVKAALAERDRARADYERVLGTLARVEANAQRLNINPDELYRSLEVPPRRVARAGRRRT